MRTFEKASDYPLTVANDESHDMGPGLERWMPVAYSENGRNRDRGNIWTAPALMGLGIALCLIARWAV